MLRLCFVVLIILLCLFGKPPVYGLDLVIIPITYYERQEAGYVQNNYKSDITADIVAWISKDHDVRIDRTTLSDRLAGAADSDARRVANYYRINDVLYGSIKSDGNSLVAELKIYNSEREDYELFFASDAINQYERLIKTICQNILEWFHDERDKVDQLRVEVRELRKELESAKIGIRRKAADDTMKKNFVVRIPLSLGYWSYFDKLWVELVQGTAEFKVGLEMVPELQLPAPSGKKSEVSLGLDVGYRNGITSTTDTVMLHSIIVNPVLKYHLNFYTKNWMSLGAGIFYEHDFWDIKERQNQKRQKYQQSLTGYSAVVDYSYRIDQRFTINLGVNFYGYFVGNTSPVIRFYFGTVITLLGGDNET